MRPVEIIPGMGGRRIKEMMVGADSTLIYIVKTFINVILYFQHNNHKKKKD
jgi:hypothetical protein